jgi:ABC-2 type transport system ATP-binding protein
VTICDHDVAQDPLKARELIAYVPENVALYEHLSARENIDYFLGLARAHRTIGVIDAALASVGLNAASWDRRVDGFSKGMRQKVAIALAVARKVPVLLLDEPTSGLDPHAIGEFNRLLEALRQEGVSTLMVTHDLLSAADVADRIGFLAQGKLIEEHLASGADRFDVRQLHRHYATGGVAV